MTDMQLQGHTSIKETRQGSSPTYVPLFVDLDGTLVKSDLFFESFLSRIRKDPLVVFRSLWWLVQGRARLKEALAEKHAVNVQTLPFNDALLVYLREQAANGRTLILATGSHRILAEAVASHIGLFSSVIATEGSVNMKGKTKLEAILGKTGGQPFDYAGNDKEDLLIWASARRAVVVGASPLLRVLADQQCIVEVAFPSDNPVRSLLTAIRPHQWLKNLLVLLPLLPSVSFTAVMPWIQATIGFLAFCALASGTYLINDFLDLDADRAHPRKRHRPFASGSVAPAAGLATSGVLVVVGILLSLLLPPYFVVVAASYLALTLAYSIWLKTYMLADIMTLAGLYTLRVIAGIAAIGAPGSFWLLAFSMSVFFSLALVKRCTELIMRDARGEGAASVRGYRVSDIGTLQALGIGGACVAVLVLALYIHSPQVTERLPTPELLWPICPIMLYWLGRLWIKTMRGEMHDDPLIFAARDFASMVAAGTTVALFAAAALVNHPRLI